MVEIREILESEELNDAVQAIERLLAKRNLSRKLPGQKNFRDLALGKTFRASEVLAILLGEEPTYPGLRDVLLAGFVGWILFPNDTGPRLALMTQAVLGHMDDAERTAGFVDQPVTLGRDIIARYVITGFDFLSDIYHEFGGYEAFTRSNSLEIMDILFSAEEKTINTTVRALAYLHHGADRYRDPEYDFAPSLNRAVTILAELKKLPNKPAYNDHYVSRSLLHKRWSQTKQTLALMYAASTIKVNRKSLLQIMQDGQISYQIHLKFLPNWMGRAKYVCDHVFGKMDNSDLQRKTARLLGSVEAQPFKAPVLTTIEEKILIAQFRKKFDKNRNNPL